MAQNQNQKTYSFLNNNEYFTIPNINLKYIQV